MTLATKQLQRLEEIIGRALVSQRSAVRQVTNGHIGGELDASSLSLEQILEPADVL